MRLPKIVGGVVPSEHKPAFVESSDGILPQGTVVNSSSHSVWITANNTRHCLAPGENSNTAGIGDADGLLLDGRGVFFDSLRTDLGGGQVHHQGAIKVCSLGTLTVHDAPTIDPVLLANISTAGYICPGDSAGHKTPRWCSDHRGWDINTTPVTRPCS